MSQSRRNPAEESDDMAYFRKVDGKWRAEVEREGKRKSKRFLTKREAELWAAEQEALIARNSDAPSYDKTVAEAVDRYIRDVTSKKATALQERRRLLAFLRDFPLLAAKRLADVTASDWAGWRDARLEKVSPASVLREMTVLVHMCKLAGREWQWMQRESPWDDVERPQSVPPRQRRIAPSEVRQIVRAMGYVSGQEPKNKTAEIAWAFMVALRTAMRTGEILGLTRKTVDLRRRVVTLYSHKTAKKVGMREVPLTRHGARLLGKLHAFAAAANRDALFTVDAASKDALFRRYVKWLGIEGLHFHDARAEALTRLSRRMDVLTLSRISGHSDLSILSNTYYRESAADIAARL